MTKAEKTRGKKLLEEYKKIRDTLPSATTRKQRQKIIMKMEKLDQKARKLGVFTIIDFEEE